MINSILTKSKEYIDSKEYDHALNSIGSEFLLNEDNVGYLASTINSIILGVFPEESFVENLKGISDIKTDLAQDLYRRSRELIFTPFKASLAKLVIDKQQESIVPLSPVEKVVRQEEVKPVEELPQPEVQPIQPQIQSQPIIQQESLNRHEILHEIENPPRTVIKKYVLEHQPITDPEHLIDDSVDARKKLEEHYSN